MSLLHVLQEGGGPLEGGGLVGLRVAERDQEVQLVTTDADPAPAGKSKRHIGPMTQNEVAERVCASQRATARGPGPECRGVSTPLGDRPDSLLMGQEPVPRPRMDPTPGIGGETVLVWFRCSSQATAGPSRAQDSATGVGCPWVLVDRTPGCQPATPGRGLFGAAGRTTFNFHMSRLATWRVLYELTLNDSHDMALASHLPNGTLRILRRLCREDAGAAQVPSGLGAGHDTTARPIPVSALSVDAVSLLQTDT